MSAIDDLETILTGLKHNRQKKIDDLALHEKCVLGIQAEIHEATKEIREYKSAIELLKNGKPMSIQEKEMNDAMELMKQAESTTTIVGDESAI